MTTCPLCGYDFDANALSCREAGCPLAELQGCVMICCPNCGYQMPDERQSKLAGLLRGLQKAPPAARPVTRPVCALKQGQSATVVALRFDDAGVMDRLCAYGIAPGSVIQLEQTRPAVILKIGETVLSVDQGIAEGILVEAL